MDFTGEKGSWFGAGDSEFGPDPASPRHAPAPRGFEAGEAAGNDQQYGEGVADSDMGGPTAGEQRDSERGPEQAAAGTDVRREELAHEVVIAQRGGGARVASCDWIVFARNVLLRRFPE